MHGVSRISAWQPCPFKPDVLDPLTIGIVTASTAILLYFDWMREYYLPPLRQQLWTLLHFPFHLSLVLWNTAFVQFMMWAKINDVVSKIRAPAVFEDGDEISQATSEELAMVLEGWVYGIFKDYPPKWTSTYDSTNEAIGNISSLPNDIWPQLGAALNNEEVVGELNVTSYETFVTTLETVVAVVSNAIYQSYEIDLLAESNDASQDDPNARIPSESEISELSDQRYSLVVSFRMHHPCLDDVVLMKHSSPMVTSPPVFPWPY
jgi:hypothetical protein